MTEHNGYQPKYAPDVALPPRKGSAYKPRIMKLEDAFLSHEERIDTLVKRIRNLESDVRQANEKISIMERLISSMRADMPEGSVTDDDDQPEIFDWEEEA